MSNLPPYSTYRTDNKQQMLYPQQLSHGNVLTFTPQGFNQTLNVKFPDCRLAVCEKCKKNYKTRDMCRVRNAHSAAPWATAYICFTLDDNCTDENGKYIDKPLAVRMVQWQPFCVKRPFHPKTPVCSACKKTNRTRSFCRERHKHRQLPWCTVYVLLSPADSIDPLTRVAPESFPTEAKNVKTEEESATENNKESDTAGANEGDNSGDSAKKVNKKDLTGEELDDGDDINDIADSRTFLAKVSCRHSSIHWLELAEFDTSDPAAVHSINPMDPRGTMMQPMDPSQYYGHGHAMGGYAAQQHQFNLKSQQQYFFQMQQRQHQQYAAHQAAWQAQYNISPPSTGPLGAPPQVTAGEAAAQQSKQNHQPDQGITAAPPGSHAQWAYHQQMYQNQMAQFQQVGGVLSPEGQQAPPEQPVDYTQQTQGDTDDIEPSPVHGREDDDHDHDGNDPKRARCL